MGCADIATVLFTKVMKFDPKNPEWPDRDRFVLRPGHGSMLLYSSLYLLGYEDATIDQIKNFRQLGSKTAGHPEYRFLKGIETTTGPLGQGIANAVGMAIAEAKLAAEFGSDVVDHHTWCLCGDGCLMEGISQEAISLAGHLNLNKLTLIWDNNGITIDGHVSNADSTDQLKRFEASGWNTIAIDGHDQAAVEKALSDARKIDRPLLIAAKTTIGFGAPQQAGHREGARLAARQGRTGGGQEERSASPIRRSKFRKETLDAWRAAGTRSANAYGAWQGRLAALDAGKKAEFERRLKGELPAGYAAAIDAYKQKLAADKPKVATRKSSQMALDVINAVVPETVGGSADLTGSNLTNTPQTLPFTDTDRTGRYMRYGIREHGMAAIMNGMALHKGLIPYGGTFLVFTDYARPAIRLSAIMEQRVIYVMTHDSIGLGEDGPTHQPVEHLAALRAIPRSAGAAAGRCGRDARMLADRARDHEPAVDPGAQPAEPAGAAHRVCEGKPQSAKGAYKIAGDDKADAVIFATGSEVAIAVEALKLLKAKGISAKVVSVPSLELFEAQSDDYRAERHRHAQGARRGRGRHRAQLAAAARREGPFRRHALVRRQRAGRAALRVLRHHAARA